MSQMDIYRILELVRDGELSEWVDGMNALLTDAGILLDGTKFKAENCCAFTHNELTNLLLPFTGDVKLDMGKLAVWRLQNHSRFYGMWLSDYVTNKLDGFADAASERQKPDCPLIGADGNIFNLMGLASRTLRESGMADEASQMCERIRSSGSYDAALCIIGEYVNISAEEDICESELSM